MKRYVYTIYALLILNAIGLTQSPTKSNKQIASKSPFEVVPVPESQTVIKEQTLIFQSHVFAGGQPQFLHGRLTFSQNTIMLQRNEDATNAIRCYSFILAAGEHMRLRLTGKSEGYICMKFVPKAVADRMTSQIWRANMAPISLRKSKIEITNITDKPYQVALMLYGQANYPYILEIERIKKK